MKEIIRHILKEETSRQTKVISMISKIGLSNAAKSVGGYKNLVNILKDIDYFKPTIDFEPRSVRYYLRGDRRYRGSTTFHEVIITDPWDLYYWNLEDYDIKDLMEELDEVNLENVRKIISNETGGDWSDASIDELIDCDDFDDIDTALRNAAGNVDSEAYGDYLQDELIKSLEEYGGKVIEFTDENVSFTVNLEKYIAEMDDGDAADVEDLVGRCGLDMSCLFDELRSYGWIDKPKPNFDDQWYNRNFDVKLFNEIVSDNLYEFLNK
jgi:hypothetical protein